MFYIATRQGVCKIFTLDEMHETVSRELQNFNDKRKKTKTMENAQEQEMSTVKWICITS